MNIWLVIYIIINAVYIGIDVLNFLQGDDILTKLYFENIEKIGLRYWHIVVGILFLPAMGIYKLMGTSLKHLFKYIIVPIITSVVNFLSKPVFKNEREEI